MQYFILPFLILAVLAAIYFAAQYLFERKFGTGSFNVFLFGFALFAVAASIFFYTAFHSAEEIFSANKNSDSILLLTKNAFGEVTEKHQYKLSNLTRVEISKHEHTGRRGRRSVTYDIELTIDGEKLTLPNGKLLIEDRYKSFMNFIKSPTEVEYLVETNQLNFMALVSLGLSIVGCFLLVRAFQVGGYREYRRKFLSKLKGCTINSDDDKYLLIAELVQFASTIYTVAISQTVFAKVAGIHCVSSGSLLLMGRKQDDFDAKRIQLEVCAYLLSLVEHAGTVATLNNVELIQEKVFEDIVFESTFLSRNEIIPLIQARLDEYRTGNWQLKSVASQRQKTMNNINFALKWRTFSTAPSSLTKAQGKDLIEKIERLPEIKDYHCCIQDLIQTISLEHATAYEVYALINRSISNNGRQSKFTREKLEAKGSTVERLMSKVR